MSLSFMLFRTNSVDKYKTGLGAVRKTIKKLQGSCQCTFRAKSTFRAKNTFSNVHSYGLNSLDIACARAYSSCTITYFGSPFLKADSKRHNSSIFKFARNLLASTEQDETKTDIDQYTQYSIVTKEDMKRISYDKYKFDFAYSSFAFHSKSSASMVHSLSDLSDPTQLNTLLPRRRPHGSPADTLSVKAGDDAMLVSPSILAIADGVSGWESKGEQSDSGIWSRSMLETLSRLMTEYKINHAPHHLNKRDIDQILDDSYLHTSHLMDLRHLKGSSTLILGMIIGDVLKIISIGDSKFYLFRNNKIVKTNKEQMVSGLCPEQIGTQTLNVLPSDVAWVDSVKLLPNDIVIMCSDGISDNLYKSEIEEFILESLSKKYSVKRMANQLLSKAKEVGFDDYAYTPYDEKVDSLPKKYGNNSTHGGKLDDMSLCLAMIVPTSEPSKNKLNHVV